MKAWRLKLGTNKLNYGVIGNPISHSLSPIIHKSFASQTGIDLNYEKILAQTDAIKWQNLDNFEQSVKKFITKEGCGLNVTAPFKRQAFLLANSATERAKLSECSNTLKFNGEIIADNTDGIGLIKDLEENLGYDLKAKKILLVGAGGAAKCVIFSLLSCAPKMIFIANRTKNTAVDLATKLNIAKLNHFNSSKVIIVGGDFLDMQKNASEISFDMLINATSSSIQVIHVITRFIQSCLDLNKSFELIYDMNYGVFAKPLLAWAKERKIKCHDGLGMLVEQAAQSFLFWHGVLPDSKTTLRELEQF